MRRLTSVSVLYRCAPVSSPMLSSFLVRLPLLSGDLCRRAFQRRSCGGSPPAGALPAPAVIPGCFSGFSVFYFFRCRAILEWTPGANFILLGAGFFMLIGVTLSYLGAVD